MSYWDILPLEIQEYILSINVKQIKQLINDEIVECVSLHDIIEHTKIISFYSKNCKYLWLRYNYSNVERYITTCSCNNCFNIRQYEYNMYKSNVGWGYKNSGLYMVNICIYSHDDKYIYA